MHWNSGRHQRGFTLLEVLVAMSIFAIIGLGAHQMLTTVIETHARTQEVTEVFGRLTGAFILMDRDIFEITSRGVRDEYGDPLPYLMVGTGPYLLEFTRTGWNNPAGLPRSDLQRVAWELTPDGELVRHVWLVLDRAEDSQPLTQTLLTGIRDFRVNLVQEDGATVSAWPAPGQPSPPVALEVLLDTEAIGEVRRIFALVADAASAPSGPGTGGGAPNGAGNASLDEEEP